MLITRRYRMHNWQRFHHFHFSSDQVEFVKARHVVKIWGSLYSNFLKLSLSAKTNLKPLHYHKHRRYLQFLARKIWACIHQLFGAGLFVSHEQIMTSIGRPINAQFYDIRVSHLSGTSNNFLAGT